MMLAGITIAGCSSYSSMTNIFVLALSYRNSTLEDAGSTQRAISETLNQLAISARLEVRIGYYGLCVRQNGVVWLCSSDAHGLQEQIGSNNDPLGLIKAGSQFKDDVLFSGLLLMAVVISFIAMLLLATFPGWHEERDEVTGEDVDVKPFPSIPVAKLALGCTFISSIVLLIASLWQHIGCVGAAAMADAAYFANVKTEVGANMMVITWISFTLTTIAMGGLVSLIVSVILLDAATQN